MFQPKTSFHPYLLEHQVPLESSNDSPGCRGRHDRPGLFSCFLFFSFLSFMNFAHAEEAIRHSDARTTVIPILGTTLNDQWEQVGIVAEVQVELIKRDDHEGLDMQFQSTPGRFSPLARRSVTAAIAHVADAANLKTDSWTIRFTLPYAGVTLYGESLSAMAALCVVALAKDDPLHEDIVMTGTVTPEGYIGTVGGVPLKIVAAYERHFKRVLIPEEHDIADGDWRTPFLMHVSPIRSVDRAYRALTDRPLFSTSGEPGLSASLVP